MGLQLSGSLNLTGSITIETGSVTLVSGSVTVLSGYVSSPGITYAIDFDDMIINHESGSRSFFAGVGTPFTASVFGAGLDGGKLVLYPTASAPSAKYATFKSLWRNAEITHYEVYTNFTGSDFPAYDNNTNGPTVSYVSLGVAFQTDGGSATSGQYISDLMYNSQAGTYNPGGKDFKVMSAGAISNTPTEIMDGGTLYVAQAAPFTIDLNPTLNSPIYFTWLMSIGASFPTKTYKFRMRLLILDKGIPVF